MNPSLQHVAIIMDGNRRWAKDQGLPATDGHHYAAEHTIEPLIEECLKQNIPYITFWAFSTENWKRDKQELDELFKIFRTSLINIATRLIKENVRLNTFGDITKFPIDIVRKYLNLMKKTKENSRLTVTFALNYGGRDEILRAVKKIIKAKVKASDLTEKVFNSFLDTTDIPDPDLIIRTGGEQRLSGFLPWQAVYAELAFTKTLFPAFSIPEFRQILKDFSSRDRRFGGNTTKK